MGSSGSRSAGRYVLPAVLLLGFPLFILVLWTFLGPVEDSPDVSDDPVDADFADPVEDAVGEVEEMFRDLARQLRSGATGGALYHFTPDFRGTPLVLNPAADPIMAGGVEIREGKSTAPVGDRAAMRGWLREARFDHCSFKVLEADFDAESLVCRLAFYAERDEGDRRTRSRTVAAAILAPLQGRWRLWTYKAISSRVESGPVRFRDVTSSMGLRLAPTSDERTGTRTTFGRLFLGGLAAGDADGDGDTDLYVPRAGPNVFFRNDGGRFSDVAPALGLADADAGSAALFLDFDNDGDLDLLLANYEPAREEGAGRAVALFRNDGARFVDATDAAGIRSNGPAMMACAADVDLDGDLDVYVAMYHDDAKDDPERLEEIPADVFNARNGDANQLWINRGDGTFTEEAAKRGVADTGWGLAAAFADYDDDGDPDLYLANDYGGNRLFRNRGDGTFEDATGSSGVADTGFGMGVTWFDEDRDGDLDLYVSNMYSVAGNRILNGSPGRLSPDARKRLLKMARGNTLLRNNGDGTFADVTEEAGVAKAGWAWGSAAFDHDNDGLQDLYVANGFRTSAFTTSDL